MDLSSVCEHRYYALGEVQRQDWRRLAVFTGSFDAAAAAAIWGLTIVRELPPEAVAHIRLTRLVSLGLLEHNKLRYRFRLSQAGREFARNLLAGEELRLCQQRHANYYLKLQSLADRLSQQGGSNEQIGMALLASEAAEIQAGERWAEQQGASSQAGN